MYRIIHLRGRSAEKCRFWKREHAAWKLASVLPSSPYSSVSALPRLIMSWGLKRRHHVLEATENKSRSLKTSRTGSESDVQPVALNTPLQTVLVSVQECYSDFISLYRSTEITVGGVLSGVHTSTCHTM